MEEHIVPGLVGIAIGMVLATLAYWLYARKNPNGLPMPIEKAVPPGHTARCAWHMSRDGRYIGLLEVQEVNPNLYSENWLVLVESLVPIPEICVPQIDPSATVTQAIPPP